MYTQASPVTSSAILAAVQGSQKAAELFESTHVQHTYPSQQEDELRLQMQAQSGVLQPAQLDSRSQQHSSSNLGANYHQGSATSGSPDKNDVRNVFHVPRIVNGTEVDKMGAIREHHQASIPRCAAMSSHDGRWRSVQCKSSLPAACRSMLPLAAEDVSTASPENDVGKLSDAYLRQGAAAGSAGGGMHDQHAYTASGDSELGERDGVSDVGLPPRWVLGSEVVFTMETGWGLAHGAQKQKRYSEVWNSSENQNVPEHSQHFSGALSAIGSDSLEDIEPLAGVPCHGCCPSGYAFVYPQSGWDNLHLWVRLTRSRKARVMLPIIPGVVR